MKKIPPSVIRNFSVLFICTFIGATSVVLVHHFTAKKIQQNYIDKLNVQLNSVLPENLYNNELQSDFIILTDPLFGNEPITLYTAKKDAVTTGYIVLTKVEGYSGLIHLLIGLTPELTILSTNVIKHTETPGLGDKIERQKSSWLEQFNNKTLKEKGHFWAVKKDGGEIDQMTSATITSRAAVKAVKNTLLFMEKFTQQKI